MKLKTHKNPDFLTFNAYKSFKVDVIKLLTSESLNKFICIIFTSKL